MLHLTDIEKAYGSKHLFSGVSWHIGHQRRIGLVGRNGSGKTTLFRIILGEEPPDSGDVVHAKHLRIGHLVQETEMYGEATVIEVVTEANEVIGRLEAEKHDLERQLEAAPSDEALLNRYGHVSERFDALGGYALETEARKILGGLGFSMEQMNGPCSALSGGWLMRVGLSRLLLTKPDLLLLDEPSNHLDLDTLGWFEDYAMNYPGTIVFISHDRALLNRLPTEIAELSASGVKVYRGNYDAYLIQKTEDDARAAASHARAMKEVARTQVFIDRFRAKASKATAVQSRVKQLEKKDIPNAPDQEERVICFGFEDPPRSGKDVLVMRDVVKSYGGNPPVYDGVSLTLQRGDRIALTGPNGAGKTTLLRMMARALSMDAGECRLGPKTLRAYYAQHQAEALNTENTILTELEGVADIDAFPRVRSVLGALGFSGEDVEKKIHVLSGGEKARVALGKILLQPANLLLLDEPTNHLDLPSCAVLEEALKRFDGTLVLVSHDRQFINAVVDQVIEVGSQELVRYPGDFDYYLTKKAADTDVPDVTQTRAPRPSNERDRKRKEAELRNAKHRETKALRGQVTAAERRIAEIETELEAIEAKMLSESFYNDSELMRTTYEKKGALDKELETLYTEWEALGLQIEQIEQALDSSLE